MGVFFLIYTTYLFWHKILSVLKILFNPYIYKNHFQVHVLVCHLLNLKTVTSSVRPFCGLYNNTFLQISTHINHVSILVSNNHSKVWGQRRWSSGKSNNWSEECTHTFFARHKLDQEMILLGWPFHTLCRERQHYDILGKKTHSMRCNIWSIQGFIVQYGRNYFQLYRKKIFRVYPTRK